MQVRLSFIFIFIMVAFGVLTVSAQEETTPDSGVIAFVTEGELRLINPDGTDQRMIYEYYRPSLPAWSADGTRIAFADTLVEGSFYQGILVVNADGTGLTNLVGGDFNAYNPSWSPDGTRLVFVRSDPGGSQLYVVDMDRNVEALTNNELDNDHPAWSPDGTQIAFDADGELYIMDADGSNSVKLTDSPESRDSMPAWSPDGTQIAFVSESDEQRVIQIMNSDGTDIRTVTSPEYAVFNPSFSPDGTQIVFSLSAGADYYSLHIINVDGSGLQRVSPLEEANHLGPVWGPSAQGE